MLHHAFFFIDNGLSRIDSAAFSDQTRMELVVAGLDDQSKAQFEDSNEAFRDISGWRGLKFDAEGNVKSIYWRYERHKLNGSLSLDYLPQHLEKFNLYGPIFAKSAISVCGTIETAALPRGLREFAIDRQRMSGTLNLPELPQTLAYFTVMSNDLSGDLIFRGTPESLLHLDLSKNAFTGKVATEDLPRALEFFSISRNAMEGSLNLTKLPVCLVIFHAANNNLNGTINLDHLPPTLMECHLSGNAFHGHISFANLTARMSSLQLPAGRFNGIDMATKPKSVSFR